VSAKESNKKVNRRDTMVLLEDCPRIDRLSLLSSRSSSVSGRKSLLDKENSINEESTSDEEDALNPIQADKQYYFEEEESEIICGSKLETDESHEITSDYPGTSHSDIYDTFSDDTGEQFITDESDKEIEVNEKSGLSEETSNSEKKQEIIQGEDVVLDDYIASATKETEIKNVEPSEEVENKAPTEGCGDQVEVLKEVDINITKQAIEELPEESDHDSTAAFERHEENLTNSLNSSHYDKVDSPDLRQSVVEVDFDNSADEVLLYEMFGEHYDDMVESMGREERRELRKVLDAVSDVEVSEARKRVLTRIGVESEPTPSDSGSLYCTANVSDINVSPLKSLRISSATSLSRASSSSLNLGLRSPSPKRPTQQNISVSHVQHSRDKSPVASFHDVNTLKPDTTYKPSSSPSPSKQGTRPPWKVTSPNPSQRKIERTCSASKIPDFRTPSRLPRPVMTALTSGGNKVHQREAGRQQAWPTPSPVAEYIKSNPTPRLVQNVVSRPACRELESTMLILEKENTPEHSTCPLPKAVYSASKRVQESLVDLTGRDYTYIPDAYGEETTPATVTKHLSRVKKDLGAENSLQGSFLSDDEFEVSLVETRVVRKVANKKY